MKASELMIGDLVRDKGGRVWKLVLREDRLYYESVSKDKGRVVLLPIKCIEMYGIPLTCDMLKDNGFTHDEIVDHYVIEGLSIHHSNQSITDLSIGSHDVFSIFVLGGGFLELEYVHQLQLALRLLCYRKDIADNFKVKYKPSEKSEGTVTENKDNFKIK